MSDNYLPTAFPLVHQHCCKCMTELPIDPVSQTLQCPNCGQVQKQSEAYSQKVIDRRMERD